tara:strand:- start:1001 stop:2347 length:1347 start_codon:yes stop_codon:yes gene_type:complete
MRDDARSVADDASVRSSWIWALGAAFEDASDDDTRANARERTVGETRAETRGRSTRARRRVETREETSTNPRRAMDHRARAAGGRGRPFGAHLGDYSTSSSASDDDDDDDAPRPNARPPPRPKARFQRRRVDEETFANGSRAKVGREASTSKLRAMTAEAARFRAEATRERERRARADAALEEATAAGESLRREHAALTHSHERLKEARERDTVERKRQIRALKKRLTATTERESRQRRRSVAALKTALDALRAFAPTAPSGRPLGGSAVSAVIGELSALTEAIALRDCMTSDEEDAARAPTAAAAPSSWDVAETERAKARAEVLERELEDAHEIIRIAEKERVVLERELAAARREIDAQASRHDEELREATEATTRAIAIVRAREEEDSNPHTETDAVEEPTSPRARSPSSPRAGNLRGDMDALERELSQLTQSMRAALAEVDGVAP